MKKKLIIWDWNGTLLDDVQACVDTMNVMLQKRNMDFLSNNRYKDIFTFPVKNYYNELGFNFERESFENLSIEYIALYKENSKKSLLQEGAVNALDFFKENGCKQIIISASEQSSLEEQVEQRGVFKYFDSIIGLNNIHAKSKLDNAKRFINDSSTNFESLTFIGDTFHDYEVSKEIGAECILVQNGHQSLKINGYNYTLIKNLNELIELNYETKR